MPAEVIGIDVDVDAYEKAGMSKHSRDTFWGGCVGLDLVTLAGVNQVRKRVDELTNGRMDMKIRAAVADVICEEHLDPAVATPLALDRERC